MPHYEERRERALRANDLYLVDSERKHLVVTYPVWMYVILTVTGVAAFAVVGFSGYPTDPRVAYAILHPAWEIFLWFCILILIVQWSIFRDERAVWWRWQTLTVTLICIGLVAAIYTKPDILRAALDQLTGGISVGRGRFLWNLANFVPILLYAIDRAILWLRGERIYQIGATVERDVTDTGKPDQTSNWPSPWEFCAQDLFAGAALCAVLAAIFQSATLSLLTTLNTGAPIDVCSVSWIFGTCSVGGIHNPPTLALVDIVLAFAATGACLLIIGILLIPRILPQPARTGTRLVTRSMGQILRAVFNPLDIFIRDLRNIFWPSFILVGIFGVAMSARFVRLYLHLLSDKQTCMGTNACADLAEFSQYLANSLDTRYFENHVVQLEIFFLALAVFSGLVSVLTIMMAAQILVSRARMGKPLVLNWLSFAGKIAGNVLLAYWIFSLSLSACMAVLLFTNATIRAPFPQPGISTIVSLAYLCAMVLYLRLKDRRWPWESPQPTSSP